MTLKEMIKLCESKQKSLEDYKAIRKIIEKEYDKLSEEEQYIYIRRLYRVFGTYY